MHHPAGGCWWCTLQHLRLTGIRINTKSVFSMPKQGLSELAAMRVSALKAAAYEKCFSK
jgi:hypothetical protein